MSYRIENDGRRPDLLLPYAAMHGNVPPRPIVAPSTYIPSVRATTGVYPLHAAASAGDVYMVGELLRKGTNPDASNKQGFRPLHFAAEGGFVEVVRVLDRHGASLGARTNAGLLAVHLAAKNGRVQILEQLQKLRCDLTSTDHWQATPLHYAAHYGQLKAVEWLIKVQVPLHRQDNDGRTAADRAKENGHLEVVKVLGAAISKHKKNLSFTIPRPTQVLLVAPGSNATPYSPQQASSPKKCRRPEASKFPSLFSPTIISQTNCYPIPPQTKSTPVTPLKHTESTPVLPLEHTESTPVPPLKHTESTPVLLLEHSESTPVPPIKHTESTPVLLEHTESTPVPSVKQTESSPVPPLEQAKSTPVPPLEQTESTPGPPLEQTESIPGPPLEQTESTPVPPLEQTESTPVPPLEQTESTPVPSVKQTESTPVPSPPPLFPPDIIPSTDSTIPPVRTEEKKKQEREIKKRRILLRRLLVHCACCNKNEIVETEVGKKTEATEMSPESRNIGSGDGKYITELPIERFPQQQERPFMDLQVLPAVKPYPSGHGLYPSHCNPRGRVLILNNKSFEGDQYPSRRGSECDTVNLERLYDQMGYEVVSRYDLSRADTLEFFGRESQNPKLSHVSSLFVFIMSHGSGPRTFITRDMNTVTLDEVMNFFLNSRCRFLEGKPKIFFSHFCRGNDEEIRPTFFPEGKREAYRDMLCIFSSTSGFQAYRHPILGTPSVRAFCKAMADHAHCKMLFEVIREFQTLFEKMEGASSPEVQNLSFSKDLFLNPIGKRINPE